MNPILKIFGLLIPALVVSAAGAAENYYADPTLKKIVQSSKLPESSLGLYAELYPSGKKLLSVNADELMNPASVTKLATAAAVIEAFPYDHKFRTKVLVKGEVKGSTLVGDVILQGGGDPAFVSESMWKLVNQFLRTGIRKITGHLIVDDTAFDPVRFGDSRRDKRVDRAYDAPVGALSFNWNSVNIFVRPGLKVGEKAQVWLDPESEYLTLQNSAKTVKGSGSTVTAQRVATPQGDKIIVSGQIGIGADEKVIYKSITKPALWSGEHFKAFLKRRGVEVAGKVISSPAPAGAKEVAFEESKGLAALVSDMNKFSNNYVAEMLAKNLSAQTGSVGTLAQGVALINQYLRKNGLGPDQILIKNPSGLTDENRMSAEATTRLLRTIRENFKVFPEYVASLPIAGVDGTLKNRYKNSEAVGWIRAKTGYLSGSIALAGYGGRRDGEMVIFTMIHNGSGSYLSTRQFFDKLSEALVQSPTGTSK